jgi:hypothetical protein
LNKRLWLCHQASTFRYLRVSVSGFWAACG